MKRRKPTQAKHTKASEKQIRAYYESKRGDVSDWSDKPVKIARPKSMPLGRAVFSVRFSASELSAVKKWADACGYTVSEFVREAALQFGATGPVAMIGHRALGVSMQVPDTRGIGPSQVPFGEGALQLH